ncbi:MAG TPA: NmrA family NAD(P)-binding protein [Solirubrobacteraceae bacterium]|nr:NmrA family NAD(P)-binding protein [Solirubrobacteraceae bacterium]
MARTALIAGATGFIGGRLARTLSAAEWDVRCLVRNPSSGPAEALAAEGFTLHRGDVLDRRSLRGAGAGAEVAYYLVHSMGRGSRGHFAERELRAARAFAELARDEGVGRVIYLGGLGEHMASDHLRSRHESARMLAEHGPPLTYLRAGMVVGSGSESYRTLRYLVQRLPAMIAPAWLKNATQPIAVDDAISYLAAAAGLPAAEGQEIQIGGPDVLSYGEMLDRMALALGVPRRPRVPVPFITPWLSSLWIGLVTPVDAGIARPLVEGLASPTVVTDPSGMQQFDIRPIGFDEALQRALADDPEVAARAAQPA